MPGRPSGAVAEWLRSGLQSRVHQFDSGRRLSHTRASGSARGYARDVKGWDLERRVGAVSFAGMALVVAGFSVWWAVTVLADESVNGDPATDWYLVANTVATVAFTAVTVWFARVAWAYARAQRSSGSVVGWASAVIVLGSLWLGVALPIIGLAVAVVVVPAGLAALGLALLVMRLVRRASADR